ncbi:MAG: hypothetical protein ACI4LA_00730 [Emergencia sp.]
MRKKTVSLLTALILTVVMLPAGTVSVYAFEEGITFSGSTCTSDDYAASAIDYLFGRYRHHTQFDSGGQCFGYAVKVNDLLTDVNNTRYYDGLRFNRKNFLAKCLNAKAGTHLRLSCGSSFNGGYGHSVVLLQVTEDKVYWADNNFCSYNKICYCSGSVSDFLNYYGKYGYINMVSKPVKYRKYVTPKLSARVIRSAEGIRLTWLKSTSAESYEVYRSYSRNGTYKLIAVVDEDKTRYLDDEVKENKKAYYKVKAVRKGEDKTSSVVSCTYSL